MNEFDYELAVMMWECDRCEDIFPIEIGREPEYCPFCANCNLLPHYGEDKRN